MKPFALFSALILWTTPAMAEVCQQPMSAEQDPIALYGTDRLQFDILRKGKKIGLHEVRFSHEANELHVNIHTKINVSVLFVPVFSYDYRSEEVWCGGDLTHVQAVTVENGKRSEVTSKDPGFATGHWNIFALDEPRLFNTITGRHNEITVQQSQDFLLVDASNQRRAVNRFVISGQLNYSSWYDPEGRWVKLRFEDKGGVPIEFDCNNCIGFEGQAS